MIHLNIGSNLESKFGDRFENISTAINLLSKSKVQIKKISDFYKTPSYPDKKLPYFINIGLTASYRNNETQLYKIGRNKSKKNDPRVCDIDIIDFNSAVINKKNLQIPHDKSHLRNFVLYPILQIDPEWVHPIFKKKVKLLINKLDHKSRIEITRLNKNVIIKS